MNNKQREFYESMARYGAQARTVFQSTCYIADRSNIPLAINTIKENIAALNEWGASFSAIGPTETKDPLIHAWGSFVFNEYATFLYLAGTIQGQFARVRVDEQFIDMIAVFYGSQWDENDLKITFHLQISNAGE